MVEQLATGWQNVAQLLIHEPEAIFSLLFDAKEFQFAKKLADVREVNPELKLVREFTKRSRLFESKTCGTDCSILFYNLERKLF